MSTLLRSFLAILLLVVAIVTTYKIFSWVTTSEEDNTFEILPLTKHLEPNVNLSYCTCVNSTSVIILVKTGYLYYLLNDLRRANKSIHIVMFLMKYDPGDKDDPVNMLLDELVRARERGVDVKVILEYVYGSRRIEDNVKAYDFLRQHNISVKLDRKPRTIHTKLVIIDGKIVYIGSHNWSESALKWNDEVSVRISSPNIARELENYFARLWSSISG